VKLNSKQIAQYTGGSFIVEPIDASALASSITWDSREVQPGSVFVALPGERVDGHDFVSNALRDGAHIVLVQQPLPEAEKSLARECGAAVIEVANTQTALVDLACAWRSHLTGKVIALSGSTGKTTTKNLVRDMLSPYFSVVATRANQNNELGVPRTLLAADVNTQVIIVEMGMRGLGQLASLCDYVRPDWALITNVGTCHMELLGSQDAIVRAKAEAIAALPAGVGVAFVNGSCPNTPQLLVYGHAEERGTEVCAFTTQTGVWATDIALDANGFPHFALNVKDADGSVQKAFCRLQLMGLHNITNACAAASVGVKLGMKINDIAAALAQSKPESGRQEICRAACGARIINDAYNANPDSMKSSLETFAALKATGAHIAVLGDMGELGALEDEAHKEIGRICAHLGLDSLVCVGALSEHIACEARNGGMKQNAVFCTQDAQSALDIVRTLVGPDDVVLVKASHFMGLTAVVEGLEKR